MRTLTPILFVPAIEPCLAFWRDRLGFTLTAEVPHGERLGFVILRSGALEVMLQSWASAEDDDPGLVAAPRGHAGAVYLKVDDFAATLARLEGADVVVGPRRTFYGADEVWVREPGGHLVGFARFPDP